MDSAKTRTKHSAINWTAVITALITAIFSVVQGYQANKTADTATVTADAAAKSDQVAVPINACIDELETMHLKLRAARGHIIGINARLTAVERHTYQVAESAPRIETKSTRRHHRPRPRRVEPPQPLDVPDSLQAGLDRSMKQLEEEPAALTIPRYKAE
jgi:hypothetical protein